MTVYGRRHMSKGLWSKINQLMLVGGLEQFLFFLYIYGNSTPNWLIFFRGVEATNQYNQGAPPTRWIIWLRDYPIPRLKPLALPGCMTKLMQNTLPVLAAKAIGEIHGNPVWMPVFMGNSSIFIYTGWWFGTFFIFPYIGNNQPNPLLGEWIEGMCSSFLQGC